MLEWLFHLLFFLLASAIMMMTTMMVMKMIRSWAAEYWGREGGWREGKSGNVQVVDQTTSAHTETGLLLLLGFGVGVL